LLDGEALKRLVSSWPRIRAESAPVGRALSKEEIGTLRAYCDGRKPFEGAYLWAMLACALGAGLRRDEIARLGADALSDDARHLLVVGKGQKERVHPIPASTGAALESWLAQRARVELQTQAMFPWLYHGKLRDLNASPWAVWRAIRDAGRGAKLAPFTPHDLRRTYATHWIRTKDLATARRLMRHKDPKTTMLYDRRGDEELAAVVGEIDELLGG
jgi:integrase/recombinase XerD